METTPARRTHPPGYPWKIFWLLSVGCVLGLAAGLPYIYALFRNVVAPDPLPMPLPVLVGVQLMQGAIVFGGLVALGILLARKVGIDTPILQRWLYRSGPEFRADWWRKPLLWGFGIGVLTFLAYFFIFLPQIPNWPVEAEAALPVWKRLLVCFYTAINVEVLMRLFLLSFFLWLLQKIIRVVGRGTPSDPSAPIFWTANFLVALIYAVAHLPAAKSLMPLDHFVVAAVTLPTGLSALIYGYLAWKRGIEAATIAHFSTDLVLHVFGPMFPRG